MTAEPAVQAAAEAIDASDMLGCGCCATYPESKCDCGKTLEELDYAMCPVCGEWADNYFDRPDALAEIVVAAARPIIEAELRERIAAEIERGIDDPQCDHADCEPERNVYRDAARIARGGAS